MKLSELHKKLEEQGNQKFYCPTDKTYYYIQEQINRDNMVIFKLSHWPEMSYDVILQAVHLIISNRGDWDVLFIIGDQLFRAL
jgi:hypothetical protein